jgi:transposase-like protein
MKKKLICPKCKTDSAVKNGVTKAKKQKYLCKHCGASGSICSSRYSKERKEEILRAYKERASLRGIHRVYGVAITTVIAWLKKN